MPYKVASLSIYGYAYALYYDYISEFNLAKYVANLDRAIARVKEVFRSWFNVELDTAKVIDLNALKSEFDTLIAEANIPETSVPWWVREKAFVDLQFEAFIKPLAEQQPTIRIVSKSDDPYIPGLSLFDNQKNVTVEFEKASTRVVLPRGNFNIRLSGSTSDSITVPNNSYFEKAYKDFIIDVDSNIRSTDTVQWLGKALAWMELPTLDSNTILQGYQFTKSWNGVDPFHFKFVNTGGWFSGAYGMRISLTTDKDTDVSLIFRDINDYSNVQSQAKVSLKSGTQALTLQGDGFLGILPNFASTIKVENKEANVKIEEIRPLSLWEAIMAWLGLI